MRGTPAVAIPILLFLVPSAAANEHETAWDPARPVATALEVNVTYPQDSVAVIARLDVAPDLGPGWGWTAQPVPGRPGLRGETGTLRAWVVPTGPDARPDGADGERVVTIHVAFLSPQQSSETTATFRLRPSAAGEATTNGTFQARILEEATGAPFPAKAGPVVVTLGTSDHWTLPRSAVADSEGRVAVKAPLGVYSVRAEARDQRVRFAPFVPVASEPGQPLDLFLYPADALQGNVPAVSTFRADGAPTAAERTLDLGRLVVAVGATDTREGGIEGYDLSGGVRLKDSAPLAPAPAAELPEWRTRAGAVDVQSDGARFAWASPAGAFHVYSARGVLLWSYNGTADANPRLPAPFGQGIQRATAVRFSPEGDTMTGGSLTGIVHLFQASTGIVRWTSYTEGAVRAIAYAPDAARVFVASDDGYLHAFRALDGARLWKSPIGPLASTIEQNANGTLLLVPGFDGTVREFDANGTPQRTLILPVPVLGVSPDPSAGHVLVTGINGVYDFARDGRLRWFRAEPSVTGPARFGPLGVFAGVGLANAPGGTSAQAFSNDGTVAWRLQAPGATLMRYVFMTEDGSRLVTVNADGAVDVHEDWWYPRPDGPVGPPGTKSHAQPALDGVVVLLLVAALVALRRR